MSAGPDPYVVAEARVAALQALLTSRRGPSVRRIETHLSWVLLDDTHAYKLKKPLKLPFVDFSTLAARRHGCEEELRLNRRLAPSIYIEVVDVRDGGDGPTFEGDGSVLDVAVKMRRFPDEALWSERLASGVLTPAEIDLLAGRLAEFHRTAAVASPGSGYGTLEAHDKVRQRLTDGLDAWHAGEHTDRLAKVDWPALRAWFAHTQAELAPLFEHRLRTGRVREGHGDLHLANLLTLGDETTAFDCLEFDPALRWIDVFDDIAFAVMDLMAQGATGFAFRLLDAWLCDSGDHDGLPALRFWLVSRALVRAHVASIAEAQGRAPARGCATGDYLRLAQRLACDREPRLAITHGLPGSGKTWASQRLLEAAGAIRVRSDVERKRLFGLGALESSRAAGNGSIYESDSTTRTYARLLDVARASLEAGWPVIVDAAFLRADERAAFAALAAELAVPFAILRCTAPLPLLRQRLDERQAQGNDASEADGAVMERLRAVAEPLSESERAVAIAVDAGQRWTPESLHRQWCLLPVWMERKQAE